MTLTSTYIEAIQSLGDLDEVFATVDEILAKTLPGKALFTAEEKTFLKRLAGGGCLVFNFDQDRSLMANLSKLFEQAEAFDQLRGGGTTTAAMLQHLVGAKMDLVLGEGRIEHHGFSVADHSTDRPGDFAVEGVALHVTTHPSEALIRKTGVNLQQGLKPVIVTYGKGVALADLLLQQSEWVGRVDVLDIGQFLMANVVERSLFRATHYKATLTAILNRYNHIVEACETDPVLKIRL